MEDNKFLIDLHAADVSQFCKEYDIDDEFFANIGGVVDRGQVHTTVKCVRAMSTSFVFEIHSVGIVIVPCDRCLADLELRIDTVDELQVRFGDDDEDDGDVVTVASQQGLLDVSMPIYQFIALSMPIKRTHEPGNCDEAVMEYLSENQTARSSREATGDDDQQPADSRWDALKNLKF